MGPWAYCVFENKFSPAEKINKRKTKISNNTPETKINSQPNSSKVDWSSRRHPGYVFNKEFNKETATFIGHFFENPGGIKRNETEMKGK